MSIRISINIGNKIKKIIDIDKMIDYEDFVLISLVEGFRMHNSEIETDKYILEWCTNTKTATKIAKWCTDGIKLWIKTNKDDSVEDITYKISEIFNDIALSNDNIALKFRGYSVQYYEGKFTLIFKEDERISLELSKIEELHKLIKNNSNVLSNSIDIGEMLW